MKSLSPPSLPPPDGPLKDVRWIVATDLPDIIPDLQQALGKRQLVWYAPGPLLWLADLEEGRYNAPQDDGTGVSDVAVSYHGLRVVVLKDAKDAGGEGGGRRLCAQASC